MLHFTECIISVKLCTSIILWSKSTILRIQGPLCYSSRFFLLPFVDVYIFGQRIELSTLEWTLNHEIVVKTVPSYHLGLRKKKKNGANVYNMS